MAKLSIISAIVALLAVSASASAAPAPVNELVTGPGLPSLESLGLTRKDLENMGRVKIPESYNAHRARSALLSGKRAQAATIPTCEDNYTVPKAGAQVCINYLSALGTKPCVITGKFVQVMCTDEGASISGANIKNLATVQSSCGDVAIAAQWIYDNCGVDTTNMNAGAHFAHGNGDLLVSVVPA
ncbi:hypothetical protein V495_02312 [Pseudogymnoascus sp. VKM F-4514 (FW-929)]|nr:hypothetical protein V490_04513 [Pseudogymnoascus sp. VKM F-3557]KFY46679.1 hypothetical protein V495_02312 [Pseudogymnoascus sp. VKM F-4514 (FW-929)]KFY59920.1 hypothetical protein V497_04002 [Pseudogymnoascus sp. VKM F-4516 (FW-969)]